MDPNHSPKSLSSLADICLKLLSRQLISILTEIQHSEADSYIGREKQLSRILGFFRTPPSASSSSAPATPYVAPHLVGKLVRLYVEHLALDRLDYGPDDLPLLFYLSICSIYSDIDAFGFTARDLAPDRRHSYHQLRLDRPIELDLVQKHLQPAQCMTILNLTGDKQFADSGLVNLHLLIGKSLGSIILDHTSVTDHGIAHLSRPLSIAPEASDHTSPPDAFRELRSISLRGLDLVTDRSAKKFARFPNLLSIDLTGTSCTDATRLILNRSQLTDHKQSQFRPARSAEELEFFSLTVEPSERLGKLITSQKQHTATADPATCPFFFQINRSDRVYSKARGPSLESPAFSKRFQPFLLLRRSPSLGLAPSSSISTAINALSPSFPSNSLPPSAIPSIKRKRLNPSILDDLPQVRRSLKK